ncbi:MAG: hypothetical protein NTX52_11050, partial [Planctomycetota bacterium]|nr:hypothetical protein [Planctomycetota bacterium]
GQIKNLGMENVKVNAIGGLGVGGLVGYNDYGSTITNCYVTGSVSGYSGVGGLVGYNNGTITNCYSTASVSGEGAVGGLVGLDFGGTILNCYATSTVTGGDDIGGLIGAAGTVLSGPSISSSFASGTIAGNAHIGGLVGIIEGGEILDCYATVDIDGNDCIGGLIGCFCGTTISYCYSSGKVSGDANTGGFVGYFVGCESYPPGSYLGCFWDSNVNPDVNGIGNTSNPNVVGKPTAEMKTKSTFTDAGWDFLEIWLINNGATYPILRQEIRCDLNGDGFINLLDFAILASHWLEGGK